jgi:hypothetical protein
LSDHRFNNPFHDVWVTETLSAQDYVARFSPVIVNNAEALFSPGHVIVKGYQGSGKSMLLGLLDTDKRIEFAKQKNWPVKSSVKSPFVGAYVNLVRENASQAGLRAKEIDSANKTWIAAQLFSDYVDTLFCIEILKSLNKLNLYQHSKSLPLEGVRIDLSTDVITKLFSELRTADAADFFLLEKNDSLEDLLVGLVRRLKELRAYFNFSSESLSRNLVNGRREFGEIPRALASAARISGLVPPNTLFILCIDQYEEVFELERNSGLGSVYRQVINSGIARREQSVAYRVGTRRYAWDDSLSVLGSGAPIELNRDYHEIDLDQILRRGENRAEWQFPKLAEDVLVRLFLHKGYQHPANKNILRYMFGSGNLPDARARFYTKDVSSPSWADLQASAEVKAFLAQHWLVNPLSAWLGAAWLRQKAQLRNRTGFDMSAIEAFPWGTKPYWVKERNEAALVQIAGSRQQALIWSGSETIQNLAGSNILALMSICGMIWAAWLRLNGDEALAKNTVPVFPEMAQRLGIQDASDLWLRKIRVGNDDGDRRYEFVVRVAGYLRQAMLDDKPLSNPGNSGFSLDKADFILGRSSAIERLKIATDYGDLLGFDHTTKLKDQAPRSKFYLHPLLSPFFRLPHIKTKEPKYLTMEGFHGMINGKSYIAVNGDPEFRQLDIFTGLN